MSTLLNLQILGASYGLLFSIKALLAGHNVRVVCTEAEASLIKHEGIQVSLPGVGNAAPITLCSRNLPGQLSATTPDRADLNELDLVVFAMQEPQYRVPELRSLLRRIATAELPCLSIMNMPPLPFLSRFASIDHETCVDAYTDANVWSDFNPDLVTHCGADPQAVRPPSGALNALQVKLPTNFRAAPFAHAEHTDKLNTLAASIQAASRGSDAVAAPTPVKLKVYPSLYTGLSKLPMLITGNYRCVQSTGIRSIKDAVHADLALSRTIYQSISTLLQRIGCPYDALVPFEKYAAAACALKAPSSAAKALERGVTDIERVDCLVQLLAQQCHTTISVLDDIIEQNDAWLSNNRAAVT